MIDREGLTTLDDTYVWHPFTPHSVYRHEDPLMIVEGDGHYLIDADGRRLLDGVSSLWCSIFGHRRPEIDAAVHSQLDRIAHSTFLGNASAPAVTLAKRLIEHAPTGLQRVFYSDNGSTSVEVALKMAYQYWQQVGGADERRRTGFLTVGNAYHGDTVGAVSLGSIEIFSRTLPTPVVSDSPGAFSLLLPLSARKGSIELLDGVYYLFRVNDCRAWRRVGSCGFGGQGCRVQLA